MSLLPTVPMFESFSKLPPELQLKIWLHIIDAVPPRFVSLCHRGRYKDEKLRKPRNCFDSGPRPGGAQGALWFDSERDILTDRQLWLHQSALPLRLDPESALHIKSFVVDTNNLWSLRRIPISVSNCHSRPRLSRYIPRIVEDTISILKCFPRLDVLYFPERFFKRQESPTSSFLKRYPDGEANSGSFRSRLNRSNLCIFRCIRDYASKQHPPLRVPDLKFVMTWADRSPQRIRPW